MNKYFLSIAVCFSTLIFTACGNRQQTDSHPTDSTINGSAKTTTDIPVAGHLAELGLTPDSHWRGINLGDDFSKVKTIEKSEPFESDSEHSGYTVDLKNLESADMLYYQANKKVSAINVDLFLNSRKSVSGYQTELASYFTSRYGSSKPIAGGMVWTGPKKETIALKDVSKGKDFGLKIKIDAVGSVISASAK